MFSQTVEYALRAMTQMARVAPDACTTKQIADETKVPGAYLAKVLQSMRRAGLIHSRRGVGGGVTLARPPKKISLLEVINAVEPFRRTPGGRPGQKSRGPAGPLDRKLDETMAHVQKTYAATSLADVAGGRAAKNGSARNGSARPSAKAKAPSKTKRS